MDSNTLDLMFDDDLNTFWHSGQDYNNKVKKIGIVFKVSWWKTKREIIFICLGKHTVA